MLKIIAISGSLRKKSYNTGLIRAAQVLKPEDTDIEYFEIKGIPLYDEDIKANGIPEKVIELWEKIRNADGIILAVPEYNYSFTAALKNILDWVSRLPEQPIAGKPLAMMGASTGIFGTVRAQMHLRQVLVSLNARVMNKPEVYAGSVKDKFDADGNLTDGKTKEHLIKMLAAFYLFIKNDNRT
ncbi:MAG: NAD(P)H-dependent oxidoreductase [Ignavibacteria bacterium]|nr:NAD(P)H-dependent oxidoreductase [Ignavibacteria bacterium]